MRQQLIKRRHRTETPYPWWWPLAVTGVAGAVLIAWIIFGFGKGD